MVLRGRPSETKLKAIFGLIAEILGDDTVRLTPHSCAFQEDFTTGESIARCQFTESEVDRCVEGSGLGPADALYKSLVSLYREDYRSLDSVQFNGFAVEADFSHSSTPKSDAVVEVVLETSSRTSKSATFRERSTSLNSALVGVVFKTVEFYINCERVFVKLREMVEESGSRGRNDLKHKYTYKMTSLVEVANYEKVVKRN